MDPEPHLAGLHQRNTATAVNILFIEPMRKRVSSVLAMPSSRLAWPKADAKSGAPFLRDQHGAGEAPGRGAAGNDLGTNGRGQVGLVHRADVDGQAQAGLESRPSRCDTGLRLRYRQ